MKTPTILAAVVAAVFLLTPASRAQVGFSVQIGPAPVCPYGYFPYPPYQCAPYGYYGPEWFNDGIFIGAGPWFRGPRDFHGWVNNRYSPRYGYRGEFPHRGDHDQWEHDHWHGHPGGEHFRGNQRMDGRGHTEHGHPHD